MNSVKLLTAETDRPLMALTAETDRPLSDDEEEVIDVPDDNSEGNGGLEVNIGNGDDEDAEDDVDPRTVPPGMFIEGRNSQETPSTWRIPFKRIAIGWPTITHWKDKSTFDIWYAYSRRCWNIH